jgi:hypothetical protein
MQHADDRDANGHHFVEDHIVLNGIRPYGHCPIGFNLAGKDRHRPDPDIGRSRKRTLKPMEAAVEVTATSRTPPTFLDPTPIFIGPRSPQRRPRGRAHPTVRFSGCAQRRPLQPVVRRCASHPRDSRQPMFEALKSTKRSSTRILFAYFIPCMHSFGSTTPRLLTILNLPLFAWAMYMFIRT